MFVIAMPPITPLQPVACPGCGRPPNHVKAYAIGQEIIHCPRCKRKVTRSLRSERAVWEWNSNKGDEAK